MNIIFPKKVKPSAYAFMIEVLRFPDQVDYRMDNKICRITETEYGMNPLNIKPQYITQLTRDRLCRIQVHGIDDREFMVLQSLLEDAGEEMLIIKQS
jgi:hypothetical protein